ncbi:hypothetical protein GUITHDRAFT_138113 [Guillardia theta CCMP2712]|uniref:Sushi domain-containing protein n=1 Tax=Guillardia theta (strain CCMP2712) TaxID=905079 RepID=L1JF81_GUITC|nr:hypothetical protein GUITHDRAFT_138113 [Guillardia theta CCMP2712]EKX46769.1 hypothetical protein GUITHDRAFT_138113 [Guillardia theta CCMP2712]|eukprot:XP_005833749.1 hypothetical protein GUITHDRAFT_138113 [Guillardia theta CCMP2712]
MPHPLPATSLLSFLLVILLSQCQGNALQSCPAYPWPAHGRASPSRVMGLGEQVEITCDVGYQPSSLDLVTPACLGFDPAVNVSNLTTAEALGYSPGSLCMPISCGRFLPPANSEVTPTGEVFFNQTVKVACLPGFTASGVFGSSDSPRCQPDGSFTLAITCQRVPLQCANAFDTRELSSARLGSFRRETCHPSAEYCVSAFSQVSGYFWYGCGPPIVEVAAAIIPVPDWENLVTAADGMLGRKSPSWLSSHFICTGTKLEGEVYIESSEFGGGNWTFSCCCSQMCNLGFRCAQAPLGQPLSSESSVLTASAECKQSTGCYQSKPFPSSQWRYDPLTNQLLQTYSPELVGLIDFNTTSKRPPGYGEDVIGYAALMRGAADSWVAADAPVLFVDTSRVFPYAAKLKAWEIVADAPCQLMVQVWRKTGNADEFMLVSSSSVQVTSNYGSPALFLLPEGEQTEVAKGDVIGWGHTGPGHLVYDGDSLQAQSIKFVYGSSTIGASRIFIFSASRRYSIRAFFDPTPLADSWIVSAPQPNGSGCYDWSLSRYGLHCSQGSMNIPVVNLSDGSREVSEVGLQLFVVGSSVFEYTCCKSSMCNQLPCVRAGRSCGLYPRTSNAIVTPNSSIVVPLQHVNISCVVGYSLSGEPFRKVDPQCLKDGSFESGEVCLPVSCGRYSPPPNGRVWPLRPILYGENVTISCVQGYELVGGGAVNPRCTASGKFEEGKFCSLQNGGAIVGVSIAFFLLVLLAGFLLLFTCRRLLSSVRSWERRARVIELTLLTDPEEVTDGSAEKKSKLVASLEELTRRYTGDRIRKSRGLEGGAQVGNDRRII